MAFLISPLDARSLTYKDAVRVASSSNVSIAAAPALIDGVALLVGERVLLFGQSNASQNGIYVYQGVGQPLVRSKDANTIREFKPNMYVPVSEGTKAEYIYQLTNDADELVQLDGGVGASTFTFAAADFNEALANAWLATKTTDQLSEGLVNQYFTDGRAQLAVVTQTITNSVTNKAPSEDAVYDALLLKEPANANIQQHIASTSNPHSVTKTQVGLSNVQNVDQTNASNITSGTLGESYLPTGINANKIADGTVDNTEFQYLNGVTSAVQTQLDDKEKKGYYTRITKTSDYSIAATDDYIGCDSSGTMAGLTLTLPAANTVLSGKRVIVKDEGGSATSKNISLAPNGTDKIDGVNASESLLVNYESITLVCNGVDGWFII